MNTLQQLGRGTAVALGIFVLIALFVTLFIDFNVGWQINAISYDNGQPVYHCSLGDPNTLNKLGCQARAWHEGAGVE